MKIRVIICQGVSASGKSTWAQNYADVMSQSSDRKRVCVIERDDIRKRIFSLNYAEPFSWRKWKRSWEKRVTVEFYAELQLKIVSGKYDEIVIADTNLNPVYLDRLMDFLEEYSCAIEILTFPVSYEEAVKRDAARCNGVGPSVIARQFEKWNDLYQKQYRPDTRKETAFIFDLDGTLADHKNIRRPYEWNKVHLDRVNETVRLIANSLATKHDILIVSGRDGCCEELTQSWLRDNMIFPDGFFMRAEGDNRPDTVVKEEIFWSHIASHYNVLGVFDDRPKVARMWRSLGLQVFQVGNPHLEF